MKKWRFFCTSSGTFGTSVCVSVPFFPDQLKEKFLFLFLDFLIYDGCFFYLQIRFSMIIS